eukprot:3895739-Pyramimonas_sp.AAC.1
MYPRPLYVPPPLPLDTTPREAGGRGTRGTRGPPDWRGEHRSARHVGDARDFALADRPQKGSQRAEQRDDETRAPA